MSEAQIFKICHDEQENMKIKCSKFRQAIAKLIPTDDSNLLDAIERLHIECKSCEIPSNARNESQEIALKFHNGSPRKLALRYCDAKVQPLCLSPVIKNFDDCCPTSLEEAVQPIKHLVKTIDSMVSSIKQNCQNPINNLTLEESAPVMLFSMEVDPHNESLSAILNETLCESDEIKLIPWFSYMKLLMCSLLKLPSCSKQLVYRGASLDLSKQYPTDKRFVWQGFDFCTSSREMVEKSLQGSETRTIFEIESYSGRNIRPVSCFQDEEEILLLSGRHYQVISCNQSTPTLSLIHIREIEYSALPSDISPIDDTSAPCLLSIPYQNLDLEVLIANQTDTWIKLENKNLTDQDLYIVARHAIIGKKCYAIDLGCNQITCRGVPAIGDGLSVNRTIKRLYLSDNHLSDDGVRALASYVKNSSLAVLGLSGNQVTNDGARWLGELLRFNGRLKVLGLENNRIGDEGIRYLARGLRSNNSLKRLLLGNNKEITDASTNTVIGIIEDQRSLERLDLKGCSFTSAGKVELQESARAAYEFELLI